MLQNGSKADTHASQPWLKASKRYPLVRPTEIKRRALRYAPFLSFGVSPSSPTHTPPTRQSRSASRPPHDWAILDHNNSAGAPRPQHEIIGDSARASRVRKDCLVPHIPGGALAARSLLPEAGRGTGRTPEGCTWCCCLNTVKEYPPDGTYFMSHHTRRLVPAGMKAVVVLVQDNNASPDVYFSLKQQKLLHSPILNSIAPLHRLGRVWIRGRNPIVRLSQRSSAHTTLA